jgi:hypothetical protein
MRAGSVADRQCAGEQKYSPSTFLLCSLVDRRGARRAKLPLKSQILSFADLETEAGQAPLGCRVSLHDEEQNDVSQRRAERYTKENAKSEQPSTPTSLLYRERWAKMAH